MLDLTAPLELDDGRLMQVIIVNGRGTSVRVKPLDGQPYCATREVDRDYTRAESGYWYHVSSGVFIGGNERKFKVLRNVDEQVIEEDWS